MRDYERDEVPGCSTPRFLRRRRTRIGSCYSEPYRFRFEDRYRRLEMQGRLKWRHSIWKNFDRVNRGLLKSRGPWTLVWRSRPLSLSEAPQSENLLKPQKSGAGLV